MSVTEGDRERAQELQAKLGWSEMTYPTPEQLVAYFRGCPESVALEMAERFITATEEAAMCWRENHKFQVRYLQSALAAAFAAEETT